MTSLQDLYHDCLEKVLKLLPVKQILLLVLCGSHRLNNNILMSKKLSFAWSGSGFAVWPSIISSFHQLEDFSFGNVPRMQFQPVTRVNLGNLSKVLRNLELCYFDPSHDLEQYLAGTTGYETQSRTIFPGLKCLKIRSAAKISTLFISALPTTLLELRLVCSPIIGHISVVNALPRTLTKLDIGTLETGPPTNINFPPHLISLELQLAHCATALPSIFAHLPTELLRLKITQLISSSRPLTLGPYRPTTKFEVDHSQNWWSAIPKTLQCLELELDDFKYRIPNSIAFASMPLCVANLYLRHIIISEEQLSSVPNFCSEVRLNNFPSDPSELHRICTPAATSQLAVDVPLSPYAHPSLTSLIVDTGELNEVDATFLPQSITRLSFAKISSNAYPIISKLKNLHHLGVLLGTVESSQISSLSSLSGLTVGYNSIKSLDTIESLKTIENLNFVLHERGIFSSLFDSPEGFLRLPNNVKSLAVDCYVPQWNPNLKYTSLVVLKTTRPLSLKESIGCLPSTLEHLSTAHFGTSMRPSKFSKLPKNLKFLQLTNDPGIGMGTARRTIDPSIFQYLPPLYHLSMTNVWHPEKGWEAVRPLLPKSLILFEIDLVRPDWFSPTLTDQ